MDLQEAVRRLKLAHRVWPLRTTLAENESTVFGGVWLQHQPEFRVIVALRGAGFERIRKYVDGTPLAGTVEVRQVGRTYAQLKSQQAEAIRLVTSLGLPFGSQITQSLNRAEVLVADRA